MSNSKDFELYVPEKETYLPAESKNLMEQAMAIAVTKGALIDTTEHQSWEAKPSFGIKFLSDGIFFGGDITFKYTVTKQYTMKR